MELIIYTHSNNTNCWNTLSDIFTDYDICRKPLTILFSSGAWRTQTILYQNGHLSFKTIEFQMQDKGAMGYNRRTVEVMYLTSLFTISSTVPDDIDKGNEWVKVGKDVNELELIFP